MFYQRAGCKASPLTTSTPLTTTSLQAVWVTDEAADAVSGFQQTRHEPSAYIAGCTGDEDEFGLRHSMSLRVTRSRA